MTVDPSAETESRFAPTGDLSEYLFAALGDPADLTGRLCAVESVSGNETTITDAVATVLERIGAGPGPDLEILRDGDTLVARTHLGRAERIVVAGHLDTVPVEDNLPPRRTHMDGENYTDDEVIWGRGACDMKAGVAMALVTAAALREPTRDVSWVFYDHEEVDASLNGLGRVSRNHPDWLEGTSRSSVNPRTPRSRAAATAPSGSTSRRPEFAPTRHAHSWESMPSTPQQRCSSAWPTMRPGP